MLVLAANATSKTCYLTGRDPPPSTHSTVCLLEAGLLFLPGSEDEEIVLDKLVAGSVGWRNNNNII